VTTNTANVCCDQLLLAHSANFISVTVTAIYIVLPAAHHKTICHTNFAFISQNSKYFGEAVVQSFTCCAQKQLLLTALVSYWWSGGDTTRGQISKATYGRTFHS